MQPIKIFKEIGIFIGMTAWIVVLFYVLGRLSLLLAMPPAYASSIWAPAGLAAAAVLLKGYRTLPGIFIGALAIQLYASGAPEQAFLFKFGVVNSAILISIFATAQAAVVKPLIERFVGLGNPLTKPKDIIKFALLIGPVSCLIASTGSSILFLFKGSIGITQLTTTWMTWWVGDCIGVLILVPIFLILFAKPRKTWRNRFNVVFFPLVIVFVAVILFFMVTRHAETSREKLIFQHQVSDLNSRISSHLVKTGLILKAIDAFYRGSIFVDRKEFHDFLSQTIKENPSIQALEWVPMVKGNERQKYVEDAQKDGFANFKFKAKIDDKMVKDIKRNVYYPVYYVEPFAGNEKALGFNLGSNAQRLKAMNLARTEERIVATEPVKLVQEKEKDQYAILLFMPIWKETTFKGFALSVYRLEDLLNEVINTEDAQHMTVYLNGPRSSQYFALSHGHLKKLDNQNIIPEALGKTPFYVKQHIKFGHESWAIYYVPTTRYIASMEFWFTWSVLAGGLLFVIVLTLLMLTVSGQTKHIQEEVADKTKQLKKTAHYDTLTGIPNRAYFMEIITALVKEANKTTCFALFFIDVDNFKSVNDSFGHRQGDAYLVNLVQLLSQQLRGADFFARLGGDEFTLICNGIKTTTAAKQIAQKILTACEETIFDISDQKIRPRVSIGVALYDRDGNTVESLMTNADLAMYHAKKLGGNQLQSFSKKIAQKYIRRTRIKAALTGARGRNEFSMNFQPIVSSEDGSIYGVEALIRWNHFELGPVSPAEFIPIAEETGQILKIGEWAIDYAMANFSKILKNVKEPIAKNLVLSLNISAVQLSDDKTTNHIIKALKTHEFPAKNLLIELTETALIENIKSLHNKLEQLGKTNIMIALDDFGSGYSSLNYLQRLPISMIKIDMAFIRGLPKDKESLAIVKTIIELAKNIHANIIAEGVETKTQAKLLRDLECAYLQGYHYAKPMSTEDLIVWINNR